MNSEINQIMSNRQNRFNQLARERLNNNNQDNMMNNMMNNRMNNMMNNNSDMVNDFRNDNDLQMNERQNMLNNDNDFMTQFDESYYLEDMKNDKITKIDSEGKIIDDETTDPVKQNLKKKSFRFGNFNS